MPDPPVPLYLDEDVSVVVAAILCARGFDVLTARDTAHLGLSDSEQLSFAAHSNRVLLTHNRVDFERLHNDWLEGNLVHSGILVAVRRSPTEMAARIGRMLVRLSADDFRNQLFYV